VSEKIGRFIFETGPAGQPKERGKGEEKKGRTEDSRLTPATQMS
jgi:hypothetical protein